MTIPFKTKPTPTMGQVRDTYITNPVNNEVLGYNPSTGLWTNQNGFGIQVMTTTQRDALTPYTGQVIYNSTDSTLQVYDAGWTNVGGGTPVAVEIDFMMIAGGGAGGGGGGKGAGGAGAGGYRTSVVGNTSGGGASAEPKLHLALGASYTIEIGAGGIGNNSNYGGSNGGNTILGTLTALGGGRGGVRSGGCLTGGSGGGGATGGGCAGKVGEGYAGGAGNYSNHLFGGGGGAGGVGANMFGTPYSVNGAAGGIGQVSTIITTAEATTAGVGVVSGSDLYFGGGGGSSRSGWAETGSPGVKPGSDGAGGLGGGGAGNATGNGGSGLANTGGGGGGSQGYNGGNGGSGCIIFKITDTHSVSGLTGLTYSTFTRDGFKFYIITAGSSNSVVFTKP